MITNKSKYNEENMQNAFENFKEIEERLGETKIKSFEIAKQSSVDIDNVNFAIFFIFRNRK